MRDLRGAIRNQPAAEHDYDWAPIHMPGAVQSYGVLLVADPKTRRVLFVSDNARDMFGIAPADIIDNSYLQLAEHERERKNIAAKVAPDTILFPNPMRMTIRGRSYDAVFHAHAGVHNIELEPAQEGGDDYDEMSARATAELYNPPSIEELYQRAVRTVREVSGFDRVMLYRFDARYNGQVIAESTRDGIGSFLGLFFPSSDIGARSRELYLTNFTRYIPDIGAKVHGLTSVFPGGGHADSGHPVDMSHTNLRAVWPCHITYLQNIGIQASMSFSINIDGKLWGLFACHHYEPRNVSYDQRVVCEQAAMMFIFRLSVMSSGAARLADRRAGLSTLSRGLSVSAALTRRLEALDTEWRGSPEESTARTMLAKAVRAVQAESTFLLSDEAPAGPATGPSGGLSGDLTLSPAQKTLLALVEADSAAIVRHGRVIRIGDAPTEMSIYAISSMFGRELPDIRAAEPHVFATDCLTAVVPATESIKDRAAGILAVSLSQDTPAYLIWFRREQIVHATWAGNPAADALAAGTESQNPRASFEAWKQDIRNLSRSWVLEDVQIADELAAVLRGLDASTDPLPRAWFPATASRPASMISPLSGPGGSGAGSQYAPPLAGQLASAPIVPPRRVIRIGQR
jgi:light-regulated signal transduction histidine kinase (bacteriophytochrome)